MHHAYYMTSGPSPVGWWQEPPKPEPLAPKYFDSSAGCCQLPDMAHVTQDVEPWLMTSLDAGSCADLSGPTYDYSPLPAA
jgi:hypothetical protein